MHPSPLRRRLLLALLAGALLGTTVACEDNNGPSASGAQGPVPAPVVRAVTNGVGLVDWAKPLVVRATGGTLHELSVLDATDVPLEGTLEQETWTSQTPLVPSSPYHVRGQVQDAAGHARDVDFTVRTTDPAKVLTAVHSPRSDRVVGVGLPAIITLNRSVRDPADRAAVVGRLSVTTTPHVDGAWRWVNDKELHYRGAAYWAKGTRIQVDSELEGLRLSKGVWGKGSVHTKFRVGSRVISVVDVAAKRMTVTVDGKLVRTLKVSTGRDKYPTRGGVHLVLEKVKVEIMDSATVGIPRNAPDGYYEKVPNSVRISYGGAFVHSASWSVRDQGVRNVSHGCVNISPSDAAWFFDLVKRGDVVDIIHAKAPPLLSDPGMSDWNIPFSEWAN
jgi:lipoprotein-anchoring transpeptidase ErfK/SrfK